MTKLNWLRNLMTREALKEIKDDIVHYKETGDIREALIKYLNTNNILNEHTTNLLCDRSYFNNVIKNHNFTHEERKYVRKEMIRQLLEKVDAFVEKQN